MKELNGISDLEKEAITGLLLRAQVAILKERDLTAIKSVNKSSSEQL